MMGWSVGVVLLAKTNYLDAILIPVIEENYETIKRLQDSLNEVMELIYRVSRKSDGAWWNGGDSQSSSLLIF
jgi:hypothetical protein